MKIPGRDDSQATGIGLFLQVQIGQHKCDVIIQALQSKRQHHFMLMRQLFFLRQRWRGRFSYNKLLFLTDNLSLARASATNSISAQQVPWELRDVMASLQI
jgi:hypothetical protein